MKKQIRIVLVILVSVVSLFGCDLDAGKHFNEWVEKGGNKYYYNGQGEKIRDGFIIIAGYTYVFDKSGKNVTSEIVTIDNKKGIVNQYGYLVKSGWYVLKDNWYYIDNEKIQTEWVYDKGNWYYLGQDGKKCTNKWVDNKYYVDDDGKMLQNTTKVINGTKYSFDKKGVGEVWTKFKITLDKELPCLYEHKDKETGKMYEACQLIDFHYDVKENYATKNNDVTFYLKAKLLYSTFVHRGYNDTVSYKVSLIDNNGLPAKIEPIIALIGTFDTFDNLTGLFEFSSEGEIATEKYTVRDIADGNYTFKFDFGW